MRKIIGFLFPWRQTFSRLELEKHWWHRLAIVLFFIALVPLFLCSWVIGDEINGPSNTYNKEITYFDAQPLSQGTANPSSFKPLKSATEETSKTIPPDAVIGNSTSTSQDDWFAVNAQRSRAVSQKTIEMPNGKTVTFPSNISDDAIASEWQHRLKVAEREAVFYGLIVALLVTLVCNYVLQAIYRMALYVIYGANAQSAGR